MARKAQPQNSIPASVEEAWRDGGEVAACKAIIIKYAKVLDMTDSGRDIKPLASGMFETIDRLKSLEAIQGKKDQETPLLKILKAANE